MSRPPRITAADSELSALREELALLTHYSTDTVYRLDYTTMRYSYVSPNVKKLLGYEAEELKQLNLRDLILETRLIDETIHTVESFSGLEFKRKARQTQKWQADYLMKTKDGKSIWVADVSYPWRNEAGEIIGSVGSLRDISERMYAEAQMRDAVSEITQHDALTGLGTRGQFFQKMTDELKRSKRSRSELSVLMLQLDGFSQTVAPYSPAFGDYVLKESAKLMLGCLRETDLACRIDGDKFGIVLCDTGAEGAFWVAERLRTSLQSHEFKPGLSIPPVHISASIGLAASREPDADHAASLFSLADFRLNLARQKGKNHVVAHDGDIPRASAVH